MWLHKLAPQSKSKLAPAESSTAPPLPNHVHHHLHPPHICILSAVLVSFLFFSFSFSLFCLYSYPCPIHIHTSMHPHTMHPHATHPHGVSWFFLSFSFMLIRICMPTRLQESVMTMTSQPSPATPTCVYLQSRPHLNSL